MSFDNSAPKSSGYTGFGLTKPVGTLRPPGIGTFKASGASQPQAQLPGSISLVHPATTSQHAAGLVRPAPVVSSTRVGGVPSIGVPGITTSGAFAAASSGATFSSSSVTTSAATASGSGRGVPGPPSAQPGGSTGVYRPDDRVIIDEAYRSIPMPAAPHRGGSAGGVRSSGSAAPTGSAVASRPGVAPRQNAVASSSGTTTRIASTSSAGTLVAATTSSTVAPPPATTTVKRTSMTAVPVQDSVVNKAKTATAPQAAKQVPRSHASGGSATVSPATAAAPVPPSSHAATSTSGGRRVVTRTSASTAGSGRRSTDPTGTVAPSRSSASTHKSTAAGALAGRVSEDGLLPGDKVIFSEIIEGRPEDRRTSVMYFKVDDEVFESREAMQAFLDNKARGGDRSPQKAYECPYSGEIFHSKEEFLEHMERTREKKVTTRLLEDGEEVDMDDVLSPTTAEARRRKHGSTSSAGSVPTSAGKATTRPNGGRFEKMTAEERQERAELAAQESSMQIVTQTNPETGDARTLLRDQETGRVDAVFDQDVAEFLLEERHLLLAGGQNNMSAASTEAKAGGKKNTKKIAERGDDRDEKFFSTEQEQFLKELTLLAFRALVQDMGKRLMKATGQFHEQRKKIEKEEESQALEFFGLEDGVSTLQEAQQAYKMKAREMHPDKNGGTDEAKEAFQDMKALYDIVKQKFSGGGGGGNEAESSHSPSKPSEKKAKEAYDEDSPTAAGKEKEASEADKTIAYDPNSRESMLAALKRMLRQIRNARRQSEELRNADVGSRRL